MPLPPPPPSLDVFASYGCFMPLSDDAEASAEAFPPRREPTAVHFHHAIAMFR